MGQKPPAKAGLVTGQPAFRFAVAAFDAWPITHRAVEELRSGVKPLKEVSYLALRDVLLDGPVQPLCELPFAGAPTLIACSAGPVAERLAARLDAGAPSLEAALGTWLIARHAAQVQRSVEKRKIVLWTQLFDNDDEQRAYRTLLAAGCNSVGVHDLVGG